MEIKPKMIYWKCEKFWVGKLLEYPEIMTQGETLEELEENMKDAYMLMTMEDVPEEHEIKDYRLENDPRFLERVECARSSMRSGKGTRIEELSTEQYQAGPAVD